MNIAICGLVKSENLGEMFIAESLASIINEVTATGHSFTFVDIMAKGHPSNRSPLGARLHSFLGRVANHLNILSLKNVCLYLRHIVYLKSNCFRKRLDKYFNDSFSDVDVIVIDGAGLLEYSWNEYQEYLLAICEWGGVHNIPVVFNAIGRAGEFNTKDYRCKVLQKCFANPCVKYVSARDSAEDVQKCVGDRFQVKLLADAAFCLSDYYPANTEKKDIIGIGLIRANAFSTYEDGLSEEETINLFVDIAKELSARGENFEFFTNGFVIDQKVGEEVIKRLGYGKLVIRPTSFEELINTITSYKGIITCRMHSAICAFSYGISAVALSWNKKLDKFSDQIGYPERCIQLKNLSASAIVDRFMEALTEGVNESKILHMKSLAKESVSDYKYLFEEKK